jgi:hypothetical protein
MEASRRDGTDEWMLPEGSRPPSVKELEARIDVAMSRARSAETAASAIGAAAIEAADQARRSADAAERTYALLGERLAPEPNQAPFGPADQAPRTAAVPPPSGSSVAAAAARSEVGEARMGEGHAEDPMRAFIARADRISLRLQRLQSVPLSASR